MKEVCTFSPEITRFQKERFKMKETVFRQLDYPSSNDNHIYRTLTMHQKNRKDSPGLSEKRRRESRPEPSKRLSTNLTQKFEKLY